MIDDLILMQRTNLSKNDGLIDQYQSQMHKEFIELQPFLPPEVKRVVEIGPGVGGMAVEFAKAYPGVYFQFVDLWEVEHSQKSCNTFDTLRDYLLGYRIQEEEYEACDPLDFNSGVHLESDVVISLLSMEFHYKRGLYWDTIINRVKPKVVIYDVRKDDKFEGKVVGYYGRGGEAKRLAFNP